MSSNQSAGARKKEKAVVQLEDRHEFIPYYSHYNPHTIFTKNGELMQIIKIEGNLTGEDCENLDGVHASVSATIRHVISQSNVSTKFAFWLHTIRKRSEMPYAAPKVENVQDDNFVAYVGEQWEKDNSWQHVYKNEVYLTIIYEGQNVPFISANQLGSLLFPRANSKARNKYLDMSYPVLDKFTKSVLEALRTQCSVRRIGLVERVAPAAAKINRPPIFYSEPMEFLGTILNLRSEQFPLPDVDLSIGLQTSKLSFGFNAIESRHKETGKRRFGAMLSLKQYLDTHIDDIDCVIQAPMELVISQSFSFIPEEKATKHYKAQKSYFDISGDVKSKDSFGINKMLDADHKTPVDFGENQTTIMVIVDDLRLLDDEVGKFLNEFNKLGLITVREDIMTEECFLAQIPANFEFIRRRTPIATEQIAGFCRLNRFSFGTATGNHWGDCLAIIPTRVNSPYFFNFHVQDNGHTVLFDFNSFGDRTSKILQHFLLTKALGIGARLFIFDRNQSSRMLFGKLGKKYFPMTQLNKINRDLVEDKSPRLALNPFALEESNYNISFLISWCGLLISPDSLPDDERRATLRGAVTQLYSLPPAERHLPNLVKLIAGYDTELAKLFEPWIGRGKYAGIFDFVDDSLNMEVDVLGFDMTSAVSNPVFLLPLFSYLMHRIIATVNGEPTIIVLNEAWDLLENSFFAPRLESLLEMLRERNVMVLFTTSQPTHCKETATLAALSSCCATQIYIPDELPVAYGEQEIGLNDHDTVELLHMHRQRGDFLLKQKNESTSLRVFLGDAEDVRAIFTNDIKEIALARGRFAGLPKDY